MPINYRPTSFASHAGGGGGEIAGNGPIGAGLSAGAENGFGASFEHNVGQAHQFFNAQQMHSMAANAMAAEVAVRPPAFQPSGLEAHALNVAPPTGLEAQALAAVPPMDATPLAAMAGAGEPISPMIQLIMRLPGATGLMQSFFEALGQFFFGNLNLPSFLDPALFAQHAAGAANFKPGFIPGAEHLPINMSLLPHNAPIFQGLPMAFHGLPFNHMASNFNFGTMGGQTSFSLSPEHFTNAGDALKVSGRLDLGKPQFEWSSKFGGQGASQSQGELISGPHLTEGKLASHLSGTDRLFSDNVSQTGMMAHKLPLTNTPTTPVGSGLSQSLPIANQLPNSLNASSNGVAGQAGQSSTAGSIKDTAFQAQPADTNASYRLGQPQEGTLDLSTTSPQATDMAADKVLASNQTESFRPTLGGMEKPQSAFDSSWSTPQSVPSLPKSGTPLGGLKAKQLTLDSLKPQTPSKPVVHDATRSPVMDSIGHQTKAAAHHHFGQAHDQVSHRTFSKAYSKPGASTHIRHESHPVESNLPRETQPAQQFQQTDANQGQPVEQTQATDQTQAATDQTVVGDQPAQPTSYTIQSGDCLWNIAKNQMGNALRWKEIYSMNQDILGSNPDLIHPGTTIDLPGADGNLVAQGGTYIVKPGDSLWKISQELLGDGTKWGALYQANMSVIGGDPRLILPGQQLTIPGMEGASQTVAQSAGQAGQQVAQTTQQAAQVPQTDVMPQTEVQQPAVDAQAQAQPVEQTPQAMPEQAPNMDPNQAQPSTGPGAAHGTPISAQPVQYTPQAPVLPSSPQNAPVVSSSLVPNDVLSFLRKNK